MTDEKCDGGPAFPTPLQNGMSLRDYFAAKAMQGALADSTMQEPPWYVVEYAYAMADAMLKARLS